MKKPKNSLVTMGVIGFVLSVGVSAYAAEIQSPAQRLADLTGTSVESLYEVKGDSTFGELAKDQGVLDEFKADMLANKKSILDQRVEEGRITAEAANEIHARLLENQQDCDGSGVHKGEEKLGLGFGTRNGNGNGEKLGEGQGFGTGNGNGNGEKLGEGQGFGTRNGNGNGEKLGEGQGFGAREQKGKGQR